MKQQRKPGGVSASFSLMLFFKRLAYVLRASIISTPQHQEPNTGVCMHIYNSKGPLITQQSPKIQTISLA